MSPVMEKTQMIDFNMIMDKKFEEFKLYISSELMENVKHIIQTEI